MSIKLVAAALSALAVAPIAASQGEVRVVTGHSVFRSMDGMDPCLAAIVGIVRLRVMWFSDIVLFERVAEDGSGFLYAIESGAPDPRSATLIPSGTTYDFRDPNGADWNVTEYRLDTQTLVTDNPPPGMPLHLRTFFVWVVEIGPTLGGGSGALGMQYNFVTIVDACKFNNAFDQPVQHTGSGGNATSSLQNDTTESQHLPGDPDHEHNAFRVDLYVGHEPTVRPLEE